MAGHSRAPVVAVALALLLTLSGCSALDGGTAGPTYDGDANDYLLTAEEVGDGWMENRTRDPNIEADRIESGRVMELTNGSADLQISVLVFPSAAESAAFLDEQRTNYNESGLNATNGSLGDGAIAASVATGTFLEVRQDNVYVQVVGNVDIETARRYARAQLEKVRVVG
jgi:hypothetical protein